MWDIVIVAGENKMLYKHFLLVAIFPDLQNSLTPDNLFTVVLIRR